MKRKKIRVFMKDPAWTPFEEAGFDAEATAQLVAIDEMPDAVYLNSIYQVNVRYISAGKRGYPEEKSEMKWLTHLSVKRRDRKPIRDWRHLQRIKNEILGEDIEAVELFPAEQRLVDTSNQYHLWALPDGKCFPWGYFDRVVAGESSNGAVQRPFEPGIEPPDAMKKEDANRWVENHKREVKKGK